MRQGQGNRNRNRNRNRHRSTGGSGGGNSGGGGNSSNKVFDSNGPDVKLRGTAQTIAEKYMQLGRDAQSSGDSVSAESYYQHAEHYYRVWASNQPVGASLIMSRKLGEEEFEEDGDGGDEEAEGQSQAPDAPMAAEGSEAAEGAPVEGQQGQDGQPRQNNNNNRNNRNNRERFRPRWQQRGERQPNQAEGSAEPGQAAIQQHEISEPAAMDDSGQWEAPSFLQRPAPVAASAPSVEHEAVEPPRRTRARKERSELPAPVADEPSPQGE